MARVIMRNDEQVVSSPKFKAELRGQSLEQELREILKRAAELTAEGEARVGTPWRGPHDRGVEPRQTRLVPAKGLEPATSRLQGGCSTVELRRH